AIERRDDAHVWRHCRLAARSGTESLESARLERRDASELHQGARPSGLRRSARERQAGAGHASDAFLGAVRGHVHRQYVWTGDRHRQRRQARVHPRRDDRGSGALELRHVSRELARRYRRPHADDVHLGPDGQDQRHHDGSGGRQRRVPPRRPMITILSLETPEDYLGCVAIQHEVWGADYSDTVPPAILKIVQKVGGIAIGAFDTKGMLIGFVFGITGVDKGELVHWSHQLGVRESERNAGIGRRLKEYQRDMLRAMGVKRMRWTFDPLQAKNAHLNLNRLGVDILDYVPDMYGASDSILFRGLKGTDRFIASWELDGSHPRPAASADGIPLLDGTPTECPPRFKVAVPLDI